MATVLEKELIRETGLKNEANGKEIYTILYPDENGGTLAFREEGKGGKEKKLPLKKIMDLLFKVEPSSKDASPKVTANSRDFTAPNPAINDDNVDLICLADLESTIMIQDDDIIPHVAKIKLWDFIREIREARRQANDMPPIAMHRLKKPYKV